MVMGACPTVDCCSKIDSPTLGTLSLAYPSAVDEYGNTIQSPCIVWMRAQFTEVSAFANVREKMSDWQLDNLCLQILGEFPSLTMMEFVLFCARLRSGVYEKFFGNIDPMRIMMSFRSFIEDRRQDYNRRYEEERKAKMERDAEEARCNAVGIEYIKEQVKQGKLLNVAKLFKIEVPKKYQVKGTPKVKETKQEDVATIVEIAKSLVAEQDKNIRLQFDRIFKKKYGCTPQEYIDKNDK